MTIGLLGLGALGTAAAERLTHAGFNVAGWSRSAKVIEGVETLTGDAGLQALLEKATFSSASSRSPTRRVAFSMPAVSPQ